MKKYMRYLAPVLISAIFVLAIYLLYNKLRAYTVSQIIESIDQIPYTRLVISLLLTIINYIILIGYDWLALKAIHKVLPISKVSLVSFIGQAVSYNFGALLGGTSVRFRFYSVWGFSIHEVVHLILMLAVTFWIGALGLSGIVFIIAPPVFPPELLEKMPLHDVRALGYILTAISLTYIVLCFTVRKTVHLFGKEFVFPSPRIAVAQLIVSWVDLICAAACMWVLLPSTIGVHFLDFLPGYLMAQVAVVLTHIPGGVGVFELVIIHLTHTAQEQVVFAAVLVFRLIYYILPLLVAAVLLAAYEVHQRRNLLHDAGRWLSVLTPSITAYLTFAAGCFLLISSTLPSRPSEIAWVANYLPESLIPAGHLICAITGALLLLLPYGLQRRQLRPYYATIACILLGIVAALLKGFSWPAACMAAVVLFPLFSARHRFYRRSTYWRERIPGVWLFGALGLLVFNFFLGWALYHTAWGQHAILSFDGPLNASRVLLANVAIGILLLLLSCFHAWARHHGSGDCQR